MKTELSEPIDILVPVYRGLNETRCCLESLLGHPQQSTYELIVIDDASPEPSLTAYLDQLATRQCITLLRNATNIGFVATANCGLSLHPQRDVVLLNSDTEVCGDWLDRLARCAHAGERIGTVTPFSNNATICSYPRFCENKPLPDGLTLAELDMLFRHANAGRSLDIPTAVGFCMYVRRDCLNEIGLFDEQRFGLGYGEENDFCMRASQAGWRHVLCADTFVYHVGGVSFSERTARLQAQAQITLLNLHPDYPNLIGEFIRQDPVRPLRLAVDQERARHSPEQAMEVVREQHAAATELWQHYQEILLTKTALEKGLLEAQQLLDQVRGELQIRDDALIEAQQFVCERMTDVINLQEQNQILQSTFEQAQQQIVMLELQIVMLEQQCESLQKYNQQLGTQIEQIHASRTWRYTKFLRRS